MFRLLNAFITILLQIVGISFLRAASKPVPNPPELPVVRTEDEGTVERIAA